MFIPELSQELSSVVGLSKVCQSLHASMKKKPSKAKCSQSDRSDRQWLATQRWFSKPGVRKAQNEKACLRVARTRLQQRESSKCSRQTAVSAETLAPIKHTAAPSVETLAPIRHAIELWCVDWQPEDRWPDKLEILKESVCSKSDPAALSRFWAGMRVHIEEGKEILSRLRRISHGAQMEVPSTSLGSFYDMCVNVASEVKFFEMLLLHADM
ncbi:hypothetical protein M404DRAFT_21478 [Pisolithus tinctorius Marx 270]|uniref:Uncharacterized protein n=1 Tax=Pisolithus tinctorius Marx 270 TaxID=870435 RepID=A0A0C3PAC6_PISTI|nr:hypothetical protein M404DRAFT_21478 [Pisolithus tinctorius Marx 270]